MGKGRKVICTILLACTLCCLWSCKETSGEPKPTENPYYAFQGVQVGTDFSQAQAVFGAYENRIQEDTQTTYLYAHYIVTTGTQGDREIVTSIVLRSNAVATEKEVAIGDTREKVIAAYGEDFIDDTVQGQMIYVKQDTVLTFLVDEEGVVLSITYSQISEE